jgi:uncharacterized protein
VAHENSEGGWSPQGPVDELSDRASWELLASTNLGRLALSLDGRPDIFPVNYWANARSLIFRTAAGAKLHELTDNEFVAFEVDAILTDGAWSVVAKGTASVLGTEPSLTEKALASFPPWVPVQPFVYVEISVDSIRGRRFQRHLHVQLRE